MRREGKGRGEDGKQAEEKRKGVERGDEKVMEMERRWGGEGREGERGEGGIATVVQRLSLLSAW